MKIINLKKILSVILINYIFYLHLFAQPDLTIGNYTINPTNYSKGQSLTFTITIKNTGAQASSMCKVVFYLNSVISYSNATVLNVINVPAIPPNGSYVFPFIYPIPSNYPDNGANYILLKIDPTNLVNESNENNNNFYLTQTINISSSVVNEIHFPYPILFIHGLNSSSDTWNPLLNSLQAHYGWSYGGRIDACLNMDSNTSFCGINDYNMFTNINGIQNADMYTLNFDVNPNGTPFNNSVLSNQSAIYKQGYAVRDAINLILQKTGKNKVILVGHSMGGLASRQYLQNPNYYQNDNKHHVAKLATIGTPHGGSNASLYGLEGFVGLDDNSEAVRDLRTAYWSVSDAIPGTFLFGGLEFLIPNYDTYYNYDVNCNGNQYDVIIGLNAKPIPPDIDYSCIIGSGGLNSGDDVVPDYSANLNNFYPNIADTFNLPDNTLFNVWHNHIHTFPSYNTMNIDEPDVPNLAYQISPNNRYWFIHSRQPQDKPNVDVDYFKFKVSYVSLFQLNLWDISQFYTQCQIIDSTTNLPAFNFIANGRNFLDTSINLSPGTYYLKFSAILTDYSVYYPICFSYKASNITSIEELTNATLSDLLKLYPNPASQFITIQSPFTFNSLKILDITGKQIFELNDITTNKYNIEVTDLPAGFYTIQIYFNNNIVVKKFVKQ